MCVFTGRSESNNQQNDSIIVNDNNANATDDPVTSDFVTITLKGNKIEENSNQHENRYDFFFHIFIVSI